MRNSKGQNIIEYVLVVTAVILVFIYLFLSGGSIINSPMAKAINGILQAIPGLIQPMGAVPSH